MQLNRLVTNVFDTQARTAFFGPFSAGSKLRFLHVQARVNSAPAGVCSLALGLALFRNFPPDDSVAGFNTGFNLGHPSAIVSFDGTNNSRGFCLQSLTTAAGVILPAANLQLPLKIQLDQYTVLGVLVGCIAAAAATIEASLSLDAEAANGFWRL
jgi:hypothetical protein